MIATAVVLFSCSKQESDDGWKSSEEFKILTELGVDVSGFELTHTSLVNPGAQNIIVEIISGLESGKSIAYAVEIDYSQESPKYNCLGKLDFGIPKGKKSVNMGYGEMVDFEYKGIEATGNGMISDGVLYFIANDYYMEVIEDPQLLTQNREYTENPRMIILKDNVSTFFSVEPEDLSVNMIPGYNGGVILGTKVYSSNGTLLYTCSDWWASLCNSGSKFFWFPVNEEKYVAVCFSISVNAGKSIVIPGKLNMRVEYMNLRTEEYMWSSTKGLDDACDRAGIVRNFDDRIDSITNSYAKDLIYKFAVDGKAYSGDEIKYTIIVDAKNKTVELEK